MTSDHPRVLITAAALAAALGLAAGAAAETIAGTDLEAAGLVADLPWAFEVTVEPTTEEAAVRNHPVPLQVDRPDRSQVRAELCHMCHVDPSLV